ncbi:phosphoglycerate kinase, partial [Staphylococcus warneri VCU121]
DPHKPVVAILGGAKVSDKIGVIKNLLNIADKILIGGGMAYTFLKAQGKEIGLSLLEEDKIDFAKELLESNGDQIVLPVDAKVAKEFSNDAEITEVSIDDIPKDQEAMDVGPKTVELFNKELQGAHTLVWNGPMGVFEFSNFAQGTIGVCESIANLKDAVTIIGGGDSAAAAISLGFEDNFTHISTGGGASLEYLEGKELPGIKAINNK